MPRATQLRALALALLVVLASGVAAQAPGVPPDLQAAILVRTLAYDRALKSRAGAAVVVGVVARAGDKASLAAQDEMVRAFATAEPRTVLGLPLKGVAVTFKDRAALVAWAAQEGADALYVTPGLVDDLATLRSVCDELKLASFGANRTLVEKGLAVAVVAKGGTPRLVVNLASARASGLDLDPKLLQLSEVLK